MGEKTGIAWTDATFNPWWGCAVVSPGCEHCYAETWSTRMGHDLWGPKGARRMFGDKHWAEPERWNRAAAKAGERRRVFCGSMCDWAEDRPDLVEPRARLFALIERTPWLDWLLLTKRIDSAARLLPWAPREIPADRPRPATWAGWGLPWANVWVGTTVEDGRRARERIPVLEGIPAAVRFLSMEPLLEEVDLDPYLWRPCTTCDGKALVGDDGEACACARYGRRPGFQRRGPFDWVIAGCESGDDKRPARASWFQRLRDQAKRAGVAYFLKQATLERGPAMYPGTDAARPELVTIGAGSQVKRDQVVELPYLRGADGEPHQHAEFPTPRTEGVRRMLVA